MVRRIGLKQPGRAPARHRAGQLQSLLSRQKELLSRRPTPIVRFPLQLFLTDGARIPAARWRCGAIAKAAALAAGACGYELLGS
ncbi:hypothetical protein EJB05_01463, partial [Eragrostis curvula]